MSYYSDSDKEKAYIVYKQLDGNILKVERALGINHQTLRKWKIEFEWDKKIDQENSITEIKNEIMEIAKTTPLIKEEYELLEQIRRVEKICLAVVEGEKLEKLGIVPLTFEDAMKGLKVCWDARDKIFNKKDKGSPPKGGKVRMNYIENVTQYIGGERAPTPDEKARMVSEQAINIEFRRDN